MSAISTVHRLLDMGAAPFMIASALHAIIAQRLVRRVCDNCGVDVELTANQQAWLVTQVGNEKASRMKFRMGNGCTFCNLSGYRGRAEIMNSRNRSTLADAIRPATLEFMNVARARRALCRW